MLKRIYQDDYFLPLIIVFAVFVLLLYIFIYPIFRLDDFDGPGSLIVYYSITYNFPLENYLQGVSFTTPVIISKIYGYILNIIGWGRIQGQLVSLVIFLSSLPVWCAILKKLEFDRTKIIFIIFLTLTVEPFFLTAVHARVDSFVFLIIALVFYFFIIEKYFISAVLLFIGMDTSPTVATVCFYILAYVIWKKDKYITDKRILNKLIKLIVGSIVGFCIFVTVRDFEGYISSLKIMNNTDNSNYLFTYYFNSKYYRHVPELACILIVTVIHIKKKLYKQNLFPLLVLCCVTLSTFIMRRGNFQYVVFYYPAVLIFLTYTFLAIKKLNLFLISVILFFGLQYGYFFYTLHDYPGHIAFDKVMQENIEPNLPVIGHFNLWYPFMIRQGMSYYETFDGKPAKPVYNKFYYVDDAATYKKFISYNSEIGIKINCECQKIFSFYKTKYTVYQCEIVNSLSYFSSMYITKGF